MKRKNSLPVLLIVTLVFLGVCCCVSLICGTTVLMLNVMQNNQSEVVAAAPEAMLATDQPTIEPAITPEVIEPTPVLEPTNDVSTSNHPESDVLPVGEISDETALTLQQAVIPVADPEDIAMRLMGIQNIPQTLNQPAPVYGLGDEKEFWLLNMDTNENFQSVTKLAYITDHAYFWIEDGVYYDPDALAALANTFEQTIYPTNRAFFGSEWTPGIDNDEHLYIVYATNLGFSIAGYFSSTDSVHPLANPHSNAHETFMMNADAVGFEENFTYGVLAHEFQHMIHWYQDLNETSWLNEGFSELAALLNDFYDSGFDSLYLWDTDLQLNDWPNDSDSTAPHYGAGFLFVTYFMDRFGEDATKALVADQQNGLESVDAVLAAQGITDHATGNLITADEFFRDWTVTNLLQDSSVQDGRYNYTSWLPEYYASYTDGPLYCGQSIQSDVKQYGAEYIEISCDQDVVLNFQGETSVDLLPVSAHSGKYYFWSNKGDESDMKLTRQFDLRTVAADDEPTLDYWLWYDIETDYDYVYVMVSADGVQWDYLETDGGTSYNPMGSNYGWGYTGVSDGWVQESVSLQEYAGQEIWVRFEYVTDAAVNGEGFLVDDLSLPAIGYFADFEADDGGWATEGFVRINNVLPQRYLATLIRVLDDGRTVVEPILLNENNQFSAVLNFEGALNSATLVLSGATRFTRTPAEYQLWFK